MICNEQTEPDPSRFTTKLSRVRLIPTRPELSTLIVGALFVFVAIASTAADPSARAGGDQAALPVDGNPAPSSGNRAKRIAATTSYLAHVYSVYLGIRSCNEMAAQQKDQSFLSTVNLEQARKVMKAIDAATAEVGIDSNATWAAAAPRAEITAEALKTDPAKYLSFCQRMGTLFRIDQSNLQALLQTLGAKTVLIQKDY